MDDLFLARKGNLQLQCQPEMVKALSDAGYKLYRYITVEMTSEEIESIAKEHEVEAYQ